ncbi:MAG: hypothetical protein HQK96_01530 [Nitrospirae bacterium]|nr:hypothetical protein [Nitrospirota bacterium]
MGSGRLTSDSWTRYSTKHLVGRSAEKIYTESALDSTLDPKDVKVRESCDSADSPESTAVIIALDVTGSMGNVLAAVAKKLGDLVLQIYDKQPITNPHLMFMGIGDAEMGDRAPLQVTQFEADIRIAEQLRKIYFEQGGGGNGYESYILAWYFAGFHTKIDCFDKRKKKGFLFTIGDEEPTPMIRACDAERVLGYKPEKDFSAEEVLEAAKGMYHVYHLVIEEGQHCRANRDVVMREWSNLLGERAIPVSNHEKVAEVILSILQRASGKKVDEITSDMDADTKSTVERAIGSLS